MGPVSRMVKSVGDWTSLTKTESQTSAGGNKSGNARARETEGGGAEDTGGGGGRGVAKLVAMGRGLAGATEATSGLS